MPLGVTTVTSTVPLPGGLVAVISVSETTVIAAPEPPNSTFVAPVKPLPVMVTLSPPAPVPLAGEIAVTCGSAADGVTGGEDGGAIGPWMPGPDDDVGDGRVGTGTAGFGDADALAGPVVPFVPPVEAPVDDAQSGARESPPSPWVGQPDPLLPAALEAAMSWLATLA